MDGEGGAAQHGNRDLAVLRRSRHRRLCQYKNIDGVGEIADVAGDRLKVGVCVATFEVGPRVETLNDRQLELNALMKSDLVEKVRRWRHGAFNRSNEGDAPADRNGSLGQRTIDADNRHRHVRRKTFRLPAEGGTRANHNVTAVGDRPQPSDESITQRIIYSVSACIGEKRLIDNVAGVRP